MEDLGRRPNPPGWRPPQQGSQYNPFDPHDKRPPQGYPSEYKTPGRQAAWSSVPKNASQYRQMKETMRQLEYTPRPLSDVYPGQYKQLRRVQNYSTFNRGVQFTARLSCVAIVLYGCFFHRWNDGYENIFSTLYRKQLEWKYRLTGHLSAQQMEDLEPKFRRTFKVMRYSSSTTNDNESIDSTEHAEDTGFALERPQKKHLIEAQRVLQEQEERLLRAVDIAEGELAKKATTTTTKKSWW